MKVSFNGIGQQVATFISANTVVGIPVKMSGNGTVVACAAGDDFAGVVLSAAKGYNAVQIGGFATMVYTGQAPEPGFANLAADGTGGVTVNESGRKLLIAEVDTVQQTVTVRL